MTIERGGKQYKLTPEEIEEAYREQQRKYLLIDAEDHLADYLEHHELPKLKKKARIRACEELVDIFERYSDCNIDENSRWEHVFWTYFEEGKCEKSVTD